MFEILSLILPIFCIITLGYVLAWKTWINAQQSKFLGMFVIKVALPCLLLVNISAQNFSALLQYQFLLSYAIASASIFIIIILLYQKVFHRPLTQASVMAIGASMSNTGFIGSGLLFLFLGERVAIYFGMAFLVENFVLFLMFLMCLEMSGQKIALHRAIGAGLVNVLKNPIIIALLLGASFSALGLTLPTLIYNSLKPIGQTAAPLGLLVIGASLFGVSGFKKPHLIRDICIISGAKLILLPYFVYLLFLCFPDSTAEMIFAGVLLSSVSMVGIFAVFGQQYDMQETPSILLITTSLSIISLFISIHYLRI